MKYLIQTIIIVFVFTTIQYAQVNVQSSTGNVSIGSLSAGAQKLNLYGSMNIRHPNTTGLGFMRFANSANTQLGYMQFTNPTNLNNVDFQIETDYGDIEIDAKQELRFLVNDAVTAEIRSTGMYLKNNDFLGWDEGSTRKAYALYNGTDLFFVNDEVNGDIIISAEDRLTFRTFNTDRFTVLSNGNFGIGTTAPHEKLTVNGNVALPAGNIYGFHESGVYKAGLAYNGVDMYLINEEQSGILSLASKRYVGISTNGVEHMRVDLAGNVGINQTAPTERLHVNGGIRLGNNVGTANGTIRFNGSDLQGRVGNSWVSLTASGGGGGLWNNTGNNVFYTSGNVGIGTNSPAHKLQVNGNIGMTGEILGVSDVRTKKNIKNIETALDKINSLRAVSYEFNDAHQLEFPEGMQLGFIAQELEAVLPDLVSVSAISNIDEDEAMQLKGINYIQMIPLLTKAIQEQETKMQMQSQQLQQQQEMLDKQAKLIETLLSNIAEDK